MFNVTLQPVVGQPQIQPSNLILSYLVPINQSSQSIPVLLQPVNLLGHPSMALLASNNGLVASS